MDGPVAVFVDGDNLSSSFAGRIMRSARALGPVVMARVYGAVNALQGWSDSPSFAFRYSGSGKNATDICLAVEATEYVCTHEVKSVVLCSSDADFVHLACCLRARGVHVLGMGEEKTRAEMQAACSEFRFLRSKSPVHPKKTHLSEMDQRVVQTVRERGGSMPLCEVNPLMWQKFQTKISATDHKNWRAYFKGRESLFKMNGTGQGARVHLKPGVSD